jgi:hypothetical protein
MEGALLRVVGDIIASGLLASLTTLDVAYIPLRCVRGWSGVTQQFPINRRLNHPDIANHRSIGARTLAAALAGGGCAGLLHLDVSHTDIGDTGAAEIGGWVCWDGG